MSETPSHEVKLFGRSIPPEKERKFLLVAGAIGIVGVLLAVLKSRAGGAESPSSGQTSGSANQLPGSSGSSGSSSPLAVLPDIEIAFTESTSPAVQWGSQGSGSGSGGIHIGPFSIGGGGGSSHQNVGQLSVANTFSTNTTIHNADPGTLNAILNWLQGMAGTQEERAEQAEAELQLAYSFAQPGHTFAGMQQMEEAQNALNLHGSNHGHGVWTPQGVLYPR